MNTSLRLALTTFCLSAALTAQSNLQYPETRTVDHVDTYHGTKVSDPYRWLEDDTSAETAKWVEAQNKVTFAYLEQIPFRKQLFARLQKLYDYAKYSSPSRKGDYYFFSKNDGLQNQSVLYIQKGIEGKPEVLLDPNTWSTDGTVRLDAFAPSKDAKLAVYGISRSGSDWQEYNVLDLDDPQAARRQDRVGQGVGCRVARQRLLLQPLPAAGEGQGALVGEREPPGLLPPHRHAAVAGRAGVRGSRRTRSGSTRSRRPRTSASPFSTCPIAARASRATPSS